MKKSSARNSSGNNPGDASNDPESQLKNATPYIQHYIAELKKEIVRVQREKAKQEAAHFSATEKLKAKHAEEMKAVPRMNIIVNREGHKSTKS